MENNEEEKDQQEKTKSKGKKSNVDIPWTSKAREQSPKKEQGGSSDPPIPN